MCFMIYPTTKKSSRQWFNYLAQRHLDLCCLTSAFGPLPQCQQLFFSQVGFPCEEDAGRPDVEMFPAVHSCELPGFIAFPAPPRDQTRKRDRSGQRGDEAENRVEENL